jgi:hypothetical protein
VAVGEAAAAMMALVMVATEAVEVEVEIFQEHLLYQESL